VSPRSGLLARGVVDRLAASERVCARHGTLHVLVRVELSDGDAACAMDQALAATVQLRIPRDQQEVVHGEVIAKFRGMHARAEASACHAVVDVWSTRRDAVMAYLDPWTVEALENVDPHVAFFCHRARGHECPVC